MKVKVIFEAFSQSYHFLITFLSLSFSTLSNYIYLVLVTDMDVGGYLCFYFGGGCVGGCVCGGVWGVWGGVGDVGVWGGVGGMGGEGFTLDVWVY